MATHPQPALGHYTVVCVCKLMCEVLALKLSGSGKKAISTIRQLCLQQCFNILHALPPIWRAISFMKSPPCILLSSVLRDSPLWSVWSEM